MTGLSPAEAIVKAMQLVAAAPAYEPEQHVVHPAEYAWIKNPVGEPPTWNAVMVAWKVGAIGGEHPAARELMVRMHPPSDALPLGVANPGNSEPM